MDVHKINTYYPIAQKILRKMTQMFSFYFFYLIDIGKKHIILQYAYARKQLLSSCRQQILLRHGCSLAALLVRW